MAPHSSTLAWKILWMEEPGGLQSMGLLRVGHDWATSLSLFTFMHWRRKWQPTPVSCLENPRDSGAWWAAVYGVAQSWTQLKWRSSSNSSSISLWGCIPRRGIVGSYGNSSFNFLKNYQTFFHSCCTIYNFYQQCTRAPVYPHPYRYLFFFKFFIGI